MPAPGKTQVDEEPKVTKDPQGVNTGAPITTPKLPATEVLIPPVVEEDSEPTVQEKVDSKPIVQGKVSGIRVVATMKGFYGNARIKPGDIFTVKSVMELGSWMRCMDPSVEKDRKELITQAKLAQKKKQAG